MKDGFLGGETIKQFVLLVGMAFSAQSQTLDSFRPNPGPLANYSPIIYTAFQQSDGKIFVAGIFGSLSEQKTTNVAFLEADGAPTANFKGDLLRPIACAATLTNGTLLTGSGSLDTFHFNGLSAINSNGVYTGSWGSSKDYCPNTSALYQQGDGKILACAWSDGVTRFNTDGTLDFNVSVYGAVYSCAPQPDGKIIVVGLFTSLAGQPCINVGRLNPDGSFDSTFKTTAKGHVHCAAVQPDGKIIIGGVFTSINDTTLSRIARLNSDGSIDSSFKVQLDAHNCLGVRSIVLQTDGKILIAHDSITVNQETNAGISRINADGSLDTSFRLNLKYPPIVSSLAIQADGKIILASIISGVIYRLENLTPAVQNLSFDGSRIQWKRSGSSPEVWRTTFEASADGVDWTSLGAGERISGGWQMTGLNLPTNTLIRARGYVLGGQFNGSSWFVETVIPQIQPTIIPPTLSQNFSTNGFGFKYTGRAGSKVVLQSSSNMLNWVGIKTNRLASAPLFIRDTDSTNAALRFYRLILLPEE
jgi:uncharacterized delta-60 repeat protein